MSKNIRSVNRMRNLKKIFKDVRTYFMILLAVPIVWLIYQIVRYRILPTRYIVIIVALLLILFILMALMQYKSKKKPVKIIGKVIIVLLCIVLFIGNYTYMQTVGVFGNVSTTEDTDVVSVVVLKNSSYEYIEDLKGIRKPINRAYFTMVALDENDRPKQVPELIVRTEAERAEWAGAEKRRENRLMRKEEGF